MKNKLCTIIPLLTLLTLTATSEANDTTYLLLGEDSGSLAKVRFEQVVERDAVVRIQVQNFSDDILYVYDRWKATSCQLELRNAKDEKCAWTETGRTFFSTDIVITGVYRELEIGQQREWIIDLKEMFKIGPGEYKLAFKMDLEGKIVKSPIEKDPKMSDTQQFVRIQVSKFIVK